MICLYSACVTHGHNMVTMYMMMVALIKFIKFDHQFAAESVCLAALEFQSH